MKMCEVVSHFCGLAGAEQQDQLAIALGFRLGGEADPIHVGGLRPVLVRLVSPPARLG
jgi:hypothetical protein